MINRFWQWLALFIASRPGLVDLVIRIGQRTEYCHLCHHDGTDYMGRWWLMPRFLLGVDERGDPYPYSWIPYFLRLHHIRSEDWDRDKHDHPSGYRTAIMRGWYVEEDIYGEKHLRQQGETKTASAETFHRITDISAGGVWTLFIMTPKINEWGFLQNDVKIPWRLYEGWKQRPEAE